MISLSGTADPTSAYYEYYSDAFAQIALRDPPPNEHRQRFHAISNPSVVYGGLDLFPNDELMNFGALSYDDGALVGGNGTAAITDLALGITANPLDLAYRNWARFEMSTYLTGYSGTVTYSQGILTSIDLFATVELRGTLLGSTVEGVYAGSFSISGNQFVVDIEDDPIIDTIFAPEGAPVHLAWQFTGTMDAVLQSLVGDLNNDGFVGQDDLNILLGLWGQEVDSGSTGDLNLDGFIGQDDLNVVLGAWGTGTPPQVATEAVPEASSLLLLAATASMFVVRYRRRSVATLDSDR